MDPISTKVPAEVATITVTVVHCAPRSEPWSITLQVAPGLTVREAIARSGALEKFPEINAAAPDAGIFGRRRALDTPLAEGDRVEIYRPLHLDPKSARRLRAQARQVQKRTPNGDRK